MTTDEGAKADEEALHIARIVMSGRDHPTPDTIEIAIASAVGALQAQQRNVDVDLLRRRLTAEFAVYQGDGAVLADPDADHRPWLDARRADIDWRFWSAYKEYMQRRVPLAVIRSLDRATEDVLGLLEDPRRDGPWDTRGMVVGQVQSGKTGNYTGLICKAADAGYKFIVVLAGLHNSLRSQTQRRLDEGFLGLDSRLSLTADTARAIGVAAGSRQHPSAITLTSSMEQGDFAKGVASRVAGRLDSDSSPVLLVVKKHKSILNNLIEWVTQINGHADPATGRMVVSGFPLLVIDDEADNASVNTKKIDREIVDGEIVSETDPSEINRQIRRLLFAFDRSALVSYTATPFANIFIDGEEPSREIGEDLFPRSFIRRLDPPTNYVGPAQVFGVPRAEDPDGVGIKALPVVRLLQDHETWLTTGHKVDAVPGDLPDSAKEAIHAFMLVCAVRAARGQVDVHNSMLVHVTRFVAVQRIVYEQIEEEIERLRDRLLYGGPQDTFRDELRQLWERDFERETRVRMPEHLRGQSVTWEQVEEALPAAVGRIQVMEINGSARDTLTYSDHPDGISVIAVGGDKLSRGLTLEGLSVSYYLRASKMYDTLMQMGRWFGYREGYTDLIRLYTTSELVDWYRDITVANEELSAKFVEMARVGSRPSDFSLYVRTSPAGLLVTAQAKMRSGRPMQLTFAENVVETIGFHRDATIQQGNLDVVTTMLESQTAAGRQGSAGQHQAWRSVPADVITTMLEAFQTVERARKARGSLLARYIRTCQTQGELVDWTVVLIENSQARGDDRINLGQLNVGLTTRAYYKAGSEGAIPEVGDYTIRRLGDPEHEALDLVPEERRTADTLQQAAYQAALAARLDPAQGISEPSIGPFVRKARPSTRGLLALYMLNPAPANLADPIEGIPAFLVSFPASPTARKIEYMVPRRYWEQEAG